MADKTISISHAPDGVPTDYDTAPFLRDAGNTYGVRRVSDSVVMLVPTVLAQTGTGQYSITVTGLAADGTEYEYALERTYLGLLRRTVRQFTVTAGGSVGFWSSQTKVEQEYGVDNCAQDVDLNDTGAGTAAVWQQALDWVDALVDRIFGQEGFARPTNLTSTDYVLASGYAASLVRNEIHGGRGATETNGAGGPATGGVFQKDADEAEAALREMAESGVNFPEIFDPAGQAQGNAPVILRPTIDDEGRAVAVAADYQRPYWDRNSGWWRW